VVAGGVGAESILGLATWLGFIRVDAGRVEGHGGRRTPAIRLLGDQQALLRHRGEASLWRSA
jgi:hypothetical protein